MNQRTPIWKVGVILLLLSQKVKDALPEVAGPEACLYVIAKRIFVWTNSRAITQCACLWGGGTWEVSMGQLTDVNEREVRVY